MAEELKKVEIDGFCYTINSDKTVELSKESYHEVKNVTIPSEVEIEGKKYKVTTIKELRHCENITLPNTITSIKELYECHHINIPSSVIQIGKRYSSALRCCSFISIPSSFKYLGSIYSCNNISIDFPEGLTSLEGISGIVTPLPDTIKTIKDINYYTNSIELPSSVVSIEEMYHIQNIVIPSTVKHINRIYDCKDVTIPSSIDSIDFIKCCQLDIPSSIKEIKELSGEQGEILLRMHSAVPPVLGKAVHLGNDDMLKVPQGAAEAYKNDKMWGKFKNIVEDPTLNEGADEAAAAVAKAPDLISRIEELEKRIAALEAKVK